MSSNFSEKAKLYESYRSSLAALRQREADLKVEMYDVGIKALFAKWNKDLEYCQLSEGWQYRATMIMHRLYTGNESQFTSVAIESPDTMIWHLQGLSLLASCTSHMNFRLLGAKIAWSAGGVCLQQVEHSAEGVMTALEAMARLRWVEFNAANPRWILPEPAQKVKPANDLLSNMLEQLKKAVANLEQFGQSDLVEARKWAGYSRDAAADLLKVLNACPDDWEP